MKVTIDRKEIDVPKGTTILQVAPLVGSEFFFSATRFYTKLKTINKIGTLLIFMMLFVAGCIKKEDQPAEQPAAVTPPAPSTQVDGGMSALVNGSSWTSTKCTGVLAVYKAAEASRLALIVEASSDICSISIDFPVADSNLSVGQHDFEGTRNDLLVDFIRISNGGQTATQFFPKSGSLNITGVDNVNKKVSGKFEFAFGKSDAKTKADSLFMKNGIFTNVTYSVIM